MCISPPPSKQLSEKLVFLTPEHRKTKEWLGLRIDIFDKEPALAEAVAKILEQRAKKMFSGQLT